MDNRSCTDNFRLTIISMRQLQPISPWKLFLSIVLAFVGIYMLTQGSFFGLVFFGFAVSFGGRPGIEIDLNRKRYRKIYSVYAVNLGTWMNLPEIEYVSVFKTKKKTRTRLVTAEATTSTEGYKLNLFYSSNKHIEAYFTEDRDDAMKTAKHIADVLDTEIFDATRE